MCISFSQRSVLPTAIRKACFPSHPRRDPCQTEGTKPPLWCCYLLFQTDLLSRKLLCPCDFAILSSSRQTSLPSSGGLTREAPHLIKAFKNTFQLKPLFPSYFLLCTASNEIKPNLFVKALKLQTAKMLHSIPYSHIFQRCT